MSDTKKLTDTDVSAIDQALASAKARKATREGKPTATKAAKADASPKRPRLTDEEKQARADAKLATSNAKKAARDAARAARRSEKSASKQAPHLKKVLRAGEKLGTLGEAAQILFNDATANLPAAQVSALALQLQHFNRVKATERALAQTIEAGMSVRIVGGDPRFVGTVGTVTKAQRIRCYIAVEGSRKDLYLFTSDVEAVAAPSANAKTA